MSSLVLFDIDNTLLYTGGAGTLSMTQAFARVFDVENAFVGVEFSGRTDRAIILDALRFHGLPADDAHFDQFKRAYLELLDSNLESCQGHLKPGIPRLLDALLEHNILLGLQTGNLRDGAFRKLEYYGIAPYFQDGGFGDDCEDRVTMVKQAIQLFPDIDAPNIYVLGDTTGDVTSAKENGIFALGVATGSHSCEDLLAAGADLAVPDLGDIEYILTRVTGMASMGAGSDV